MPTNVDERFRTFTGERSEGLRPHEVVAPPKRRPSSVRATRGRQRGRVAFLNTARNKRRKEAFDIWKLFRRVPSWVRDLHEEKP